MQDKDEELESGPTDEVDEDAGSRQRTRPPVTDEEREALLAAVDGAELDSLQKRVAFLLNRFPETRDSDQKLYKAYWKEFDAEYVDGDHVHLDNLLKMQRSTSLSRQRARIQNDYKLFLGSFEVRRRRRQLSEAEKEKALQYVAHPKYSGYADESGKTDSFLVVGAIWFLLGPELLRVSRAVDLLRKEHDFTGELHFKEIKQNQLPFYRAVVDSLLAEAPTVSFTSVSVDRRGHRNTDEALRQLFLHLVLRSVEHFHASGRAPLPRSLDFLKDQENPGPDNLLLADLKTRLHEISTTRFDGQLVLDRFAARPSSDVLGLQLADLYTSSIARVLNAPGARTSPRDEFADYLLDRLGMPGGPKNAEQVGDLTVHLSLV
jgi:hypothetical protein